MFRKLGAFSYRWRYLIIAAWVAVALASIPFALQTPANLRPGGFSNDSFPSVEAASVLEQRLGVSELTIELILSHDTLFATDPEFRAAVESIKEQLLVHEQVTGVGDYLLDPDRISADGRTAYLSVGMQPVLEQAVAFSETVLPELDAGPLDLIVTGGAVLYRDLSVASEQDLRRGEVLTFALVALVLVIALRTLPAVMLPVMVGGAVTGVGLAAIYFASQYVDISLFALNVITLLGLGLAIDYALLQVFRFREELRSGHSVGEAVEVALNHAGRAILFSALTSLGGLVALAFFDLPVMRSLAFGALITILVTCLCALTFMPALLGVMGHRINRVPLRPAIGGRRNFWAPAVALVTRRPLLVVTAVTAVLVLAAWPATRLQLGGVDADVLPNQFESKRGYDLLVEEFGFGSGTFHPVLYLFEGDPLEPVAIETLHGYGSRLAATPNADRVSSYVNLNSHFTAEDYQRLYEVPEAVIDIQAARLIRETLAPGLAVFAVESDLELIDPASRRLVADIRATEPPPGARVLTAGQVSFLQDLIDEIMDKLPWVILTIVVTIYLALLLMFRSLLLPLKAVLLNFLSIMASFGILVLVFQDGHLSGLLGFEPSGSIVAVTPVILFGLLFGVSMDYEIFLLSRISEYRSQGLSTTQAVVEGLRRSAAVISGSAAILIMVGLALLTADVVMIKSFGLGLATAVFVDATLIRIVVTPAVMTLAGRWNWYLPGWLDRILPGKSPAHA